MLTLDFATTDTKTALQVVGCFTKRATWQLRSIFQTFWRKDSERDRLLEQNAWITFDGSSFKLEIEKEIVVTVWMQGETILFSVACDWADDAFKMLCTLVSIMKLIKRRDFPVKINKGDTISIKAAAAISAMAVAEGAWGGSSGVLWDMARDREI